MKNLYSKLKLGGVSFYLLKNKKAFTLVEMMVVVVIISILATIWFLRLGNYSSEANVAKRASDKKNIEQVLEMYKSKEWDYPEFEEENGEKIFWTWTWEKVKNRLPVMPIDPITKKPYKIAFIPSWKYGKIAMVDLDGEIARANSENTKNILPETEATNQLDLTALIAIQDKVAKKLEELVRLDKTGSENNFVQSVNGKVQESNALVQRVIKMITEKDFEETKVNSTRDEINNKKRELTDLLEQIESKINKFKWDAELTAKRNELTVDDLIALQRTLWEKQRELSSLDSWNSLIVKAGNETNKSNNLVQKILDRNSKPDLTLAEANNLLSEKASMKTNLEWVIRELETEINRINTQRQQALENAKNAAREEIERIAREEIGKVNTSGWNQSEKTNLIDRINTAKTTAIWNINRANSESSVTQAKNIWAEEIRKIYRDFNTDSRYRFLDWTKKWDNWIVLDKNTNLIWESKNDQLLTYDDAINYCTNLKKWNKKWRLPNAKELESLNDIDGNFFVPTDWSYWSSTRRWRWAFKRYYQYSIKRKLSDTNIYEDRVISNTKFYLICVTN